MSLSALAAHSEPDSAVRAAAAEVLRRGAEWTLAHLDVLTEQMRDEHLRAAGMEGVRDDPVLAAASLRAIRATVAHWSAALLDDPWAPVSAADDPDSLRMARDLVRRGLGDSITVAYRVAQVHGWRMWVGVTTTLSEDPAVIRLVLDHSAASIGEFNERTLRAVQEVIDDERTLVRRGDLPQRREMVELLLDGAPVPAGRAGEQLGIDLASPFTAVVLWTLADGGEGVTTARAVLEECVAEVLRAARVGRRNPRHVAVFPSTGVAWMWVAAEVPDDATLETATASWPAVRIAVGDPRRGTDGFRASHRAALGVQRLLSTSSTRRVARASDTRLAALLSRHPAEAERFVAEVLGPLAGAGEDVLVTVRTHLATLGSITRTAERLYTHRNTVMRRLERADALLPRPLSECPWDVAAALELLRWQARDTQ